MQKQLKLYYLSQNQHNSYDTYDSCVVCAYDIEDAKTIQPSGWPEGALPNKFIDDGKYHYFDWAEDTEHVNAEEIGIANENQERGVICASFNAG